ncbi:hypothetical protein [Anaerotruncus rubiinfantis]|uniref:hypothetical protein n=1 Tax=Anaerotruncus rubiinfantis TaxID=1720200 RepID=UPI003D79B631
MLTDMTEGSPAKILWRFSIPMLLSVVFQQLYNIVDSIVAGQYVGMDALAAVGASYYNIFGQESRAASPAFPPSRA